MKKVMLAVLALLMAAGLQAKNSFKDGNQLYDSGKYSDALNEYSRFITKKPDYYEGYYNAGNSLFKQEKYEEALKMYEKALELNSGDPDIKHNIEITKKKLSQKSGKPENQQNKDGKQDQDKQQQGKGQESQQGNGENKEGQQGENNKQETTNNKQGKGQGSSRQKRADKTDPKSKLNMSEDEVQALLNMMQKQEKQYNKYFGKQYRKKRGKYDFPDFFNMSPDEVMQYMERKMMDPSEDPYNKQGKNEKDW